ncbi:MAG: cellulose biosynthesis protein BcsS [Hyphomicrobiales bacterium]
MSAGCGLCHYLRRSGRIGLAIAAGLSACPDAWAGDGAADARFETFSGIAVTYDSGFAYAGGVWALGRPVEQPGLRFRALGGGGSYAYDGALPFAGVSVPTRFHGDVGLIEVMAGYLLRRGEWTAKIYAGAVHARHQITPRDPSNDVQGGAWGMKGLVELWRNLGARGFLSLDAGLSSAFGEYRVHSRLGTRLRSRFSAGGELGAVGNEDYDALRGGAFLRWHGRSGEFTLAGGGTGDYLDEDMTPYVTFDYFRRF